MMMIPLYVNSAVYELISLLVFLTLNDIAIYGAMRIKVTMIDNDDDDDEDDDDNDDDDDDDECITL